ncbi:MAG: FMN-binding protein [Fuerstiella sp.]
MSELRIITPPHERRGGWKARAATLCRCVLVVLFAMAIRVVSEQRARPSGDQTSMKPLDVEQLLEVAAQTHTVEPAEAGGFQQVLDGSHELIGVACQTLPEAAKVVGYRGPSNVLLLLDKDSTVIRAALISSDDTPEHVEAVQRDSGFFRQFEGWTLGDSSTFTDIDATTGATLTALAIAEAVAVRLGSEKPSLRFPDTLTSDDLRAVRGDVSEEHGGSLNVLNGVEAEVLNDAGAVVGRLIRTGPLVDSMAGYQGPSEVLVLLDQSGQVRQLKLRRTFDNEPYAGYLNDDDYFWSVFRDRQFESLGELDLEAEQVEGVSGATMTSMAVAETIVASAEQYRLRQQRARQKRQRAVIHWNRHDIGTAVVLLLAILIGTTRLRGSRKLRTVWLLILVGYFGMVTGNLISLAVLTGWAARGSAWRLAPGLFAVVAVSLLVPPTTKRNLYCTHLCPHGAAQQLLLRLPRKRRWSLSPTLKRWLRKLPGLILIAALCVTLAGQGSTLAAWEPFNAWIWYVAGFSSIALAVLSLLLSAVLPMAWCRYGCATGRLLEYLRHSAAAARFEPADAVLLTATVAAWTWVLSC